MNSILKKLIDPEFYVRLPSTIKFRLIRFFHEKFVFIFASKETVFTSIWHHNYWGSAESLSGGGSTLHSTENLRQKLPMLFHEYGIKTVFDAPCGDMNWMQHVLKNADFSYLGGDIVAEIVEKNKLTFNNHNVDFVKFDITADTFPIADIWICRAVLYHLSNRDIFLALERFSESNIKYILTTNCVTDNNHINKDIATGNWRSLNLMLPPFNFPKDPLWEIDDYVDPHPPMQLCLWSREQIKDVLPRLSA
jgi:hypothetical protein